MITRERTHVVLRDSPLYPTPTCTYPPPHNPASPESLQTGDILCCICFEIISYNRWVLFPEPASQPRTAPRALVAAKIRKATHASRVVQFSSQCPPMQLPPNTPLHRDGFLSVKIPVGVCFSFPLLSWGVKACLCFLNVAWSAKDLRVWCAGAAATGGQQSGCAI